MKKIVCFILVICFLFLNLVGCKEESKSENIELVNILELNSNNKDFDIQYNDDTNMPRRISGLLSNEEINDFNDAKNLIKSMSNLIGINDDIEKVLKEKRKEEDEYTKNYILTQIYNDLQVEGREIKIFVTLPDNKAEYMFNNYFPISKDFETNPKITEDEAKNIGKQELKAKHKYDGDMHKGELIIDTFNTDSPTLMWKVKTNKYTVYVNAMTGKTILVKQEFFSVRHKVAVKGNYRTHWIEVDEKNDVYSFYDSERKILLINNEENEINSFEQLKFVSPITQNKNNIDKTVADAFANITYTYDFYSSVLKWKSFDNNRCPVYMILNDTNNDYVDNAYFIKDENDEVNVISFGKVSAMKYSNAVSLDVVAHEFTHGVIKNKDILENVGQGWALHEAYADILGELIEGKNKDVWIHGEDSVDINAENAKKHIRSISFPSETGHSENMFQYKETNDPHISSTIISRVAYLMWKGALGNNSSIKDKNVLARLWFKSMSFLSQESDFKDCYSAVIKSANMLRDSGQISETQLAGIEKSFEIVGIISSLDTDLSNEIKEISGCPIITVWDKDKNRVMKFQIEIYKVDNYNENLLNSYNTDNGYIIINEKNRLTPSSYKFVVKSNGMKKSEYFDVIDLKISGPLLSFILENNDVDFSTEIINNKEQKEELVKALEDISYLYLITEKDEYNEQRLLQTLILEPTSLRYIEFYTRYFGDMEQFIVSIDGGGAPDPKKRFKWEYLKLEAKNVDWLLENLFNVIPTHTIDTEYMYYQDGYYYSIFAEAGWQLSIVEIQELKHLSGDDYVATIKAAGEFMDSDYLLKVTLRKKIDNKGKEYWSYLNLEFVENIKASWEKIYKNYLSGVGNLEFALYDLTQDNIPELITYDANTNKVNVITTNGIDTFYLLSYDKTMKAGIPTAGRNKSVLYFLEAFPGVGVSASFKLIFPNTSNPSTFTNKMEDLVELKILEVADPGTGNEKDMYYSYGTKQTTKQKYDQLKEEFKSDSKELKWHTTKALSEMSEEDLKNCITP